MKSTSDFEIIENIPEGIACLEVTGKIIFCNSLASYLFNEVSKFDEGKNIFDVIDLQYHEELQNLFIEAYKNKKIVSSVLSFAGKELELKLQWSQMESCLFAVVRSIKHNNLERQKLLTEAYTDSLTGLANRRKFYSQINSILAHTPNMNFAILAMDIDHFKRVNDTWGHDAGDAVLKHIAGVCSRSLRQTDVFARFGGEEFEAFLPQISETMLKSIAQRMRLQVEKTQCLWKEQGIKCTISVGCAISKPGYTLEQLIKCADDALYQAKRSGRNRVVFNE